MAPCFPWAGRLSLDREKRAERRTEHRTNRQAVPWCLFFVPGCTSGVQSEAEANGAAFKDRRPALIGSFELFYMVLGESSFRALHGTKKCSGLLAEAASYFCFLWLFPRVRSVADDPGKEL